MLTVTITRIKNKTFFQCFVLNKEMKSCCICVHLNFICVCKAHKKNAAFMLIEIDRTLLQYSEYE